MRTTSKGRKGQAIIMLTLAVPVVFGLLGLAADIGWMHYRQSKAQTAADAAAMAAVDRIIQLSGGSYACGGSQAVCQARTLCPVTIPATPTSTLEAACAYAKANGFAVTTNGTQWVYVSSGAGSSPPRSPGVTTSYWVSVEVIESIPQKFAAVLGKTLGSVSARSTAAVGAPAPVSCIYVLDSSVSGAFTAGGGTTVTAGCGIFVNSSSTTAMSMTNGAVVNTTVAKVVGGYRLSGGASISVTPTTGAAVTPDPFASVPAPTYSGCNYTNVSVGNGVVVTLTPGVYCNGLNLGGGATITLSPGVYVMNGGGFTISNGAHVSGSGVTIFNTANGYTYKNFSLGGGSVMTLSAPISGTYRGLLFYNDRTINSALVNTFAGGTSLDLTGSLYFPNSAVAYSGGSSTSVTAILAKTVTFSNGSKFNKDDDGQKTGLHTDISRMIE